MNKNKEDTLLDIITELKKENRILQDSLNEELQDKEEKGGLGEYVARTQFYANIPKDPFSHQYQLIHRPKKTEPDSFDDLLDPNILLSNIQDSKSMLLCQREYYLLLRFFDIGKRSPGVMLLFKNLWYSFVGQMRMTCALKSHERDLQSFLEPEISESMSWFQRRKEKKKRGSMKDMMMDSMQEGGGGLYE